LIFVRKNIFSLPIYSKTSLSPTPSGLYKSIHNAEEFTFES
jgi:hypothetical protein